MPNDDDGITNLSYMVNPTTTDVESHMQAKTVMSAINNNITYYSDDNNEAISTTVSHGSINRSLPLPALSHNENTLSDNKSYSNILGRM
jgi:hypothetical protein